MEGKCPICGNIAPRFCSGCRIVSYCSAEHQKLHWKEHKSDCRVYVIKQNDIYGRYLVAARDLKEGVVIMTKRAIVVGPRQDTKPICLGCHKNADGSYRCSSCSFPMCDKVCEKKPIHANNECKIFARDKEIVEISNYEDIHPAYECVFTVRCLMLRENDPKNWEELQRMESHDDIRKKLTDSWQRNEENTVKRLRDKYRTEEYSEELIHSAIGYAAVNAFEIRSKGIEICGLFPEVFLMAHECISNTHHSITENHQITIRATIPIKKGDLITTSYAHSMDGTLDRRRFIKDAKFFDCSCKRCVDPTEMGTFFSGVKCTILNCPGFLLPCPPVDSGSLWDCSNKKCSRSLNVNEIEDIVEGVRLEMTNARENANSYEIVCRFEKILEAKSGKVLHPNHFLLVSIIRSLTELYGRSDGWMLNDLSLELLERKETLCRRLLKVLDVIEPGLSRIRGLIKYELHASLYLLAQERFQNNQITEAELRDKLEEVITLLQESFQILSFDTSSSPEGAIADSIPLSIEGVKGIRDYFCG